MNVKHNQESAEAEKLKEIPKWTRRYAQNRTIPFLVSMVMFLLLSTAVGIPSYLGGKAYRSGNMPAFWICILFLVMACAAVIFFSVPKWGGKFVERVSRRIYGSEGMVILSPPEKMRKKCRIGLVAGLIFGSCVLTSTVLGVCGYFPIEYMQPISALYVVPFLVFLGICWQRPEVGPGPFALLWPILYGLHAILVVAGVPIQFSRPWIFLNMLIPVAGYGILCGLLGHIYSRFALRKLKRLTGVKQDDKALKLEGKL